MPTLRRSNADAKIDVMNAEVPKSVLLDPGHLRTPIRLPSTEACRVTVPQYALLSRNKLTYTCITDTDSEDARELLDAAAFQPKSSRTASKQVEMAQNDRSSVLCIDKFVKEDVDRRADRKHCKVASVLRKGEYGECCCKGQRREGGLWRTSQCGMTSVRTALTSMAMAGTNISTAKA